SFRQIRRQKMRDYGNQPLGAPISDFDQVVLYSFPHQKELIMATEEPKKIVLAYSGGLDTSVILPWLKERYPGVKLVAFAAELGQGDELKGIADKAYKSGADEVVVMD